MAEPRFGPRWRVGIVGMGRAARRIHLPAIGKVRELEVAGYHDPAVPRGPAGIARYASLDEMLAEARLDILLVGTPPASHVALCEKALLAGLHVICEKPLSDNPAGLDRLAAIRRTADRQFLVNSQFPYISLFSEAKKRMAKPGFGRMLFMAVDQTFLVTPATEEGWRGEGDRRTFLDFGTHVIDLAEFFFEERVKSVRARMPRPGGRGQDFLNLVELEFSGDRWAHITLDRLSRGRHRYLDVRLDGELAAIEIGLGGKAQVALGVRPQGYRPFIDWEVAPGGQARLYTGARAERIATAPLNLFAHGSARLFAEFASALREDRPPPGDLDSAIRTFRTLLACYESAEDGLPRELAD